MSVASQSLAHRMEGHAVRVKGLTGGSVARTVLTGILTLCLCAALGCSGSSSASSSAERVSGGEVAQTTTSPTQEQDAKTEETQATTSPTADSSEQDTDDSVPQAVDSESEGDGSTAPQTDQEESEATPQATASAPTQTQTVAQHDNNNRTVYVTQTGKRYHFDEHCRGLGRAKSITETTLGEAQSSGLTPCQICAS